MRQYPLDFTPHGHIQEIGPDLGIATHPFPSKTTRIGSPAPVIGVGTGLALGSFTTDRFPVEGIPTLLTVHQALQQIARPPAGLPRMTAILLHLLLDCSKQRRVDKGRDRDGEPLGGRHIIVGGRAARLLRATTLSPQARAERPLARFAKCRGALVGGIVQDPPDHTALPHRAPGACALARLGETATHLANRHTVPAHPVKDLTDDPCFVRVAVGGTLAPRPAAPTCLRTSRTAPAPPRQPSPPPRPPPLPLPPPMPFDNLGPLILGHHPLDLEQQIVLRAAPQFTIQEHDL